MNTEITDYQIVRDALLLTGDLRTPCACAFDLGVYWTASMQRRWASETLFCRTHGWVYRDFAPDCFACICSDPVSALSPTRDAALLAIAV